MYNDEAGTSDAGNAALNVGAIGSGAGKAALNVGTAGIAAGSGTAAGTTIPL